MTGRAGNVHSHRKITVVFEGDKLKRIEGDVVPSRQALAGPDRHPQALIADLADSPDKRRQMTTQQIAVAGSSGRMGRALIEAIAQSARLRLKAALEVAGNTAVSARMPASWSARLAVFCISADLERALPGATCWSISPGPRARSRTWSFAASTASAW